MKHSSISVVTAASFALWTACGGSGSSGGPIGGNNPNPTGVNQSALADVPVVGQFLATCPDPTAMIDSFVAGLPLPAEAAALPSASDALESGDPDTIPVIGGFIPDEANPDQLDALDVDETLAMIPVAGLSGDVPVVGTIAIVCGSVALLPAELGNPTSAPGLIAIFDENGVPVGVILATAGVPTGGTPDVVDVGLPDTGLLPDELASAVEDLLALLGLPGDPEPTPSGTPTPGAFCHPVMFPCPTGQICLIVPGDTFGTCEGL